MHRRGNTRRSEAKEALACPMLGQVDWEEKKHHLLLQKTQLEMERERLQARLAEQEERISRQNEQLQQSRLHHSRYVQMLRLQSPGKTFSVIISKTHKIPETFCFHDTLESHLSSAELIMADKWQT
uniref:Uncharacterized protein n=1 Tax=Gouania willdenowi TaxID=441366 RepID=A0A8C5DMR1_GOUWI